MSERNVSAKLLKGVRLIRAGSASDEVCRTLQLSPEIIRHLENVCQNVPDEILARLEQALSANEKLRRLIAGLGRSISKRSGNESG